MPPLAFVTRANAALRRRWHDRRQFRSTRDWALQLYDRMLQRLPRWPLPGRNRMVQIRIRDLESPLWARLGTSDLLVIEEIFFAGEYELGLELCTPPFERIIDLGANCGYSTVFWCNRFHEAHVVAVEPDSGNVGVLRSNLERQIETGQVVVIEACATSSKGAVYFDRGTQPWAFHVAASPTAHTIQVPALSLEDILRHADLDGAIDLLKCDIEGSERDLFARSTGWLRQVRQMIVEIHAPYAADTMVSDLSKVWSRVRCVPLSPPAAQRLYYVCPA